MTVAVAIAVAVGRATLSPFPFAWPTVSRSAWNSVSARRSPSTGVTRRARRQRQAGEAEAHFGGGAGLARVAAVEDDVLHLVAAQALGALLAKHPGDGVGDVALAAAVGADNRGDALDRRQAPTGRRTT